MSLNMFIFLYLYKKKWGVQKHYFFLIGKYQIKQIVNLIYRVLHTYIFDATSS